jgi:hypothetical protein
MSTCSSTLEEAKGVWTWQRPIWIGHVSYKFSAPILPHKTLEKAYKKRKKKCLREGGLLGPKIVENRSKEARIF